MKKKSLLVGLLAATTALVSLASCNQTTNPAEGGGDINVPEKNLVSISATSTNGNLVSGDTFDLSKVAITATFDDETTENIALANATVVIKDAQGNTCTGALTAGTYSATVSYLGQTATINFTVAKKTFATVAEAVEACEEVKNSTVTIESSAIGSVEYVFNDTIIKGTMAGVTQYIQLTDDKYYVYSIVDDQVQFMNANVDEDTFGGVRLSFGNEMYVGATSLIQAVYDEFKEITGAEEKVEIVEGETVYSFAYDVVKGEAPYQYLEQVSVSFVLDEGKLTSANIVKKAYYDGVTFNADGSYTIGDRATPYTQDYKLTYSAATELTPIDPTNYLFTSFDATLCRSDYDEETWSNVSTPIDATEDVYQLNYGKSYHFTFANMTPEAASYYADKITLLVDGIATEAQIMEDWMTGEPLLYVPNDLTEGEHTITLKSKNVTKEFNVNVNVPQATEIHVINYDTYAPIKASDQYLTNVLNIKASTGEGENPNYTVTLKEASEDVTITLTEDPLWGDKYYEIKITEGKYGKYVIVVAANENVKFEIEYNYVEEITPESGDELGLTGTYKGKDYYRNNVTVTFGENSTVDIVVSGGNIEAKYTYVYSASTGELALTKVSGYCNIDPCGLVYDNGTLYYVDDYGDQYALTKEESQVSTSTTYKYDDEEGDGIVIVINNGVATVTETFFGTASTGKYNVTDNGDGTYTLTHFEGAMVLSGRGPITVTVTATTITVSTQNYMNQACTKANN